MKISILSFRFLALAVACLLNVVISISCVSKLDDGQSSFKLGGLERATGPQFEVPEIQ